MSPLKRATCPAMGYCMRTMPPARHRKPAVQCSNISQDGNIHRENIREGSNLIKLILTGKILLGKRFRSMQPHRQDHPQSLKTPSTIFDREPQTMRRDENPSNHSRVQSDDQKWTQKPGFWHENGNVEDVVGMEGWLDWCWSCWSRSACKYH